VESLLRGREASVEDEWTYEVESLLERRVDERLRERTSGKVNTMLGC
jgi:hypothetical protein